MIRKSKIRTQFFYLYLILFSCLLITGDVFSQTLAQQRLNQSPRHHEWVKVGYDERTVHIFVVYPEVKEKVLAVLLIHENRGLTDWVRGVADQIAEAGYIAIAPDLLSGMAPEGGKTSDFPDRNAARDALYRLPSEQITGDLQAVSEYVKNLDACSGKLTVAGFCWGGRQTFRFATNYSDLSAAFIFYGTAPEKPEELKKISCPVYGFYGENDARVTSTVEKTEQRMEDAGVTYEAVIYKEAGHGFMRTGEIADAHDPQKIARDRAWIRWLDLLKNL